MHEIFENSYITIAAALASDDEVGFLHSHEERRRHISKPIDMSDFEIKRQTFMVREIHDIRTVKCGQALNSRAWTLQECLIPPRLLTFSTCVYLECRQRIFCECGSDIFSDPFCGNASEYEVVD